METMIKEKQANKLNDRSLKAATSQFVATHVEEPLEELLCYLQQP
jgi:hypothetical protein